MNTKLKIKERLILLNILPDQGNFATLKLVRKLREKLSFTEQENNEYEIELSNDGKSVKWNPEKDSIEKDMEFGDFENDLIKSRLKALDEEKKLNDNHYSIYEKFVGD